ncbi:hypothetical protein ACOMHN_052030 [Nucella lapillus]
MKSSKSEGSGAGKQQTAATTAAEQHLYEELAEFISASIADMNPAPLPFKANNSDPPSTLLHHHHTTTTPVSVSQLNIASKPAPPHSSSESGSSSEAVQQSQVSSSKPSIVTFDSVGSLLLEALEGFIFVVNSQGKVEFISEAVSEYLKYSQDDLCGKSIYNIIHVGDHAQFSNSLVPMSLATSLTWPNDSPQKARSFTCRMLIKPPCEEDDDVEVKQTYVSQYESMHITAIIQPCNFTELHSDSDNPTCLVCIARRVPMTEKVNNLIYLCVFTTKQDLQGNILWVDVEQLTKSYGEVRLSGRITDYCHQNDQGMVRKHYQEVVKNGSSNLTNVYRFKVQDNHYVFVQTQSKLFFNASQTPEYIISTHGVIRDCESEGVLKGSASSSLMKSIIGTTSSHHIPMGMPTPSLHFPHLGGPSPTLPLTMGGGMGGASLLIRSSPSPSLLAQGGADSLSEFDFLTSELDTLNSLGLDTLNNLGLGGRGLGEAIGSFNGDLGLGGGSSGVSQQNFLTSMGGGGAGWVGTGLGMKSSAGGGSSMTPSLQQALLGNQALGGLLPNNKPPPHPSPMPNVLVQRSNSLNFDGGQKSQRFSPSPGTSASAAQRGSSAGGFSLPAQRGGLAYINQRSPGSAGAGGGGGVGMIPNRGHAGQFSMGYRKSVSPLVSPQSAIPPSPIWGRSPTGLGSSASDFGGLGGPGSVGSMVSQPSPLQALQSMEGSQNSGGGLDMLASSPMGRSHHQDQGFPASTPPYDASPGGSDLRSGQRPGKLCQLLTQNNPLDPLNLRPSSHSQAVPRPSSTKSASSTASPGRSKTVVGVKSPDSFHQSPTPGPGTSPPEKPQSTSNEDGESGGNEDRKDNFILKNLDQWRGWGWGEGDKDKNEAEPKKTNNVLLKQLLSDEKGREHSEFMQKRLRQEIYNLPDDSPSGCRPTGTGMEPQRFQGEQLLQHLLQSEPKSNQSSITSAPAESTSEDLNGSRSRHQSGQQEPQSTTSLPLTPSPSQHLGGMGGMPATSMGSQLSSSQSMSQDLYMDSKPSTMASSVSLPTVASSSSSATGRKPSTDSKHLDQVLVDNPWESTHSPGMQTSQGSKAGRKRKAPPPPPDVDSTEDAECSTSGGGMGGPTASKLSQKNALLAQLLSKKAAKETVVNTQLTINPLGLPQSRIPKNIHERILKVQGERGEASSSGDVAGSGVGGVMVSSSNSSGQGNVPSNSRANSSFPANPDSTGLSTSGMLTTEALTPTDTSASSQLDAVLSQLVVPLDSEGQDKDGATSEDKLLQQILNQAANLREDFGLNNNSSSSGIACNIQDISSTQPPPHPPPPAPRGPPTSSASIHITPTPSSALGASSSSSSSLPQELCLTAVDVATTLSADDHNALLYQLDQMLDEGTIQTIESILLENVSTSSSSSSLRLDGQGPSSESSYVDQMAIRDIERQLLSDQPTPHPSNAPTAMPGSSAGLSMGGGGAGGTAGSLRSPPTPGVFPGGVASSPVSPVGGLGPRPMMPGGPAPPPRHPQMRSQLQMGVHAFPPSQISPQQPTPQQVSAISPGQGQQPAGGGPMFSPTGMPPGHASQFQQPRGPMGNGLQGSQQTFAPRSGQQVRQTLLRHQVCRAIEKQQRQGQIQISDRQRMLQLQQHRLALQQTQQQQQQQQQQASQQFGQRFPTVVV